MDIKKARKLAKELRSHHRLDDWDIRFKTKMLLGKTMIATTFYDTMEMHFSIPTFTINSEEFCQDQILHEIAHALVGRGFGHDIEWREKCVEIGAVPYLVYEQEYSIFNINPRCDWRKAK